jgi:hypothetical protein
VKAIFNVEGGNMPSHLSTCRSLRACTLAALGVLIVATAVRADDDDIVNSGGFELPFTTVFLGTGQLEGQVNPAGEGQVLQPGQWLRSPASGGSTAVVQSTVFAPGGGTQAVRVNRAANNDARWAVPVGHLAYPDFPNPFPPEPAQPLISITWDMRVEQTVGAGGTFGPFFGVEAYDDDGGSIGLLGSLGVDATTGDVLFQAAGTGVLTETGHVVSFGQWNRFAITLDYSADQYTIFLNSAPLGTIGFVDPGLDNFSDADLSALAAAGDAASQALTGTAYFDNFLVREGAIPEPGAAMVLAAGAGGMLLRRARRPDRSPTRSARCSAPCP